MRTGTQAITLAAVATGGMIGSLARYAVSGWLQSLARTGLFPVGTVGVNLLGCLAIGFLGGSVENLDAFAPATRAFLLVGLLGGFTTFSTFSYETMALLRDAQMGAALCNVAVQLAGGLFGVWLGYLLSTVMR